tara:strand:+ start:23 stop:676 length:654 start_codon:yes stop_codon:yes gene_type:complete
MDFLKNRLYKILKLALFFMRRISHFLSTTFAGLSLLSGPLIANEYSTKGAYFTGSIGGSKVGDVDIQNVNSDIKFDPGVGLDLGLGYDFGTARVEGNWIRGQSDGTSWLGFNIETNTTIDSVMGSVYYDFREDKQWSPFIGASIGSTTVDIDGVSESGFSYGLSYGLSYKTSEKLEVFFKANTSIVPELTFDTLNNGSITITDGNFTNATIGLRVRF